MVCWLLIIYYHPYGNQAVYHINRNCDKLCVCVCVMWVHVVVYVSAYGNWLYSVPLCYSIDTLTASAFLTTWLIGSPLYTTRLTTTVVYDALLSTVKWRIFGK